MIKHLSFTAECDLCGKTELMKLCNDDEFPLQDMECYAEDILGDEGWWFNYDNELACKECQDKAKAKDLDGLIADHMTRIKELEEEKARLGV